MSCHFDSPPRGARPFAPLVLAVVFALSGSLPSAPAAELDREELRFLEGLRARRLFELAEEHCRRRLARSELTAAEAAEWTLELARTHAEHALHVPPGEREPLWRAAREATAELARARPGHPRLLVLRAQDVLTLLALGELARQEAEVALEPEPRLAAAREHLRGAIRELEQLERELEGEHLPRRLANRNPAPGELSINELHALQANLRFQLARALRNQALTYPPESDDRFALLTQAVERLDPLAARDGAPLQLPAQLDWIRCQRLLGIAGRRRAREALSRFLQADPPADLLLAARAEGVRLELDDRRSAAALEQLAAGRVREGRTSAELDLAHLETYLALWREQANAGEEAGVEKWRKAAGEAMRSIGREHGDYWGRRAQLLVARASGDSPGDREVLLLTAKRLYLQQQWDAAIDSYAQAAAQAEAAEEPAEALELARAAAQIELEQGRKQAAEDRLREIALRLRGAPEAAAVHWTASLLAASAVRDDAALLPHYAERLAEHAERFPAGPHADEARYWLGRLRQQQGDFSGAIAAYREIRGEGSANDAERLLQATQLAAQCWREEIGRAERAGEPLGDLVNGAIAHFEQVAARGGEAAERRGAVRAAVLEGARIRLRHRPAEAETVERRLTAALAEEQGPSDWRSAAGVLLVVARALQPDRRAAALEEIRRIESAEPADLADLLASLEELQTDSPAALRRTLAELQLAAVDLLEPHRAKLTPAEQIRLELTAASALRETGRAAEALSRHEQLARAVPDRGDVQQRYAEALAEQARDRAGFERALAQWRLVLARSEPESERWFTAKYGVAAALHRMGESREAANLIRLTRTLHPDLGGPARRAEFLELLRQCE